ncbi:hypothetical protein LCGC14_2409350, partial [marine sediment metagenome]
DVSFCYMGRSIFNHSTTVWTNIPNIKTVVAVEMPPNIKLLKLLESEYTITFTFPDLSTVLFEMKIDVGQLQTSHYRAIGAEDWLPLPKDKIFFSEEMSGYIGNQTVTIGYSNILQEPYYGNLPVIPNIITEAEYDPAVPADGYSIGTAYYEPAIQDIDCFINVCNEIESNELFAGNSGVQTQLYGSTGESLNVGASIWLDEAATQPAPSGTYLWATFTEHLDTIPPQSFGTSTAAVTDFINGGAVVVYNGSSQGSNVNNLMTYFTGLVVAQNVEYQFAASGFEAFIGSDKVFDINTNILSRVSFDFDGFQFAITMTNVSVSHIYPGGTGVLIWANSDSLVADVYTINQYIYVDGNGEIGTVYTNVQGSEGAGCWLNSTCR